MSHSRRAAGEGIKLFANAAAARELLVAFDDTVEDVSRRGAPGRAELGRMNRDGKILSAPSAEETPTVCW